MVNNIIQKGALSSRNVLEHIQEPRLKKQMDRMITNQRAFVRCVALTSYCVFFLGLILLIDELLFRMPTWTTFLAWIVFGIFAVLAFTLSIYYLVARRNLTVVYANAA